MADGTKIEWTDATWNPITGCAIVSPGCANCYAMKLAGTRLQHHKSRAGLTVETKTGPVWNGITRFNEEWLDQPLRWKRPRRVFVCAHGDLFAESVPDAWIDQVFAVMALCPQHTFQVLTKRAARMRAYLSAPTRQASINGAIWAALGTLRGSKIEHGGNWRCALPLPNVWLGVSAEDQRRADERVIDLLGTPAAIRYVSAEPLLGRIQFRNLKPGPEGITLDALRGAFTATQTAKIDLASLLPLPERRPGLDWVIVGGESGHGSRPMHPEWEREIRTDCEAAFVPYFGKQWGAWMPTAADDGEWPENAESMIRLRVDGYRGPDGWPMQRVGKTFAGRLFDGAEHNGMPEARRG